MNPIERIQLEKDLDKSPPIDSLFDAMLSLLTANDELISLITSNAPREQLIAQLVKIGLIGVKTIEFIEK